MLTNNNTKAERTFDLSFSLAEVLNALEKTAEASHGIYKEYNEVLNTYTFTVSKSVFWVAKYSIQLKTNADGTTKMIVSCTGAHNGSESNSQLETFLTEMLNIFTGILTGKIVVAEKPIETTEPQAPSTGRKIYGALVIVLFVISILAVIICLFI